LHRKLSSSSGHALLDEDHLCLHALSTLCVGEFLVAQPLLLGVGHDRETGLVVKALADRGGLLLCFACGAGTDGSVDGLVDILELLALEGLFPAGELLVEALGIIGLERIVVSLDVATENVGPVLLGVERGLGLLGLDGLTTFVGNDLSLGDVEAGETLVLVGDVESTICSALHGTEDTVSGGSADETDIKVGLEGAAFSDVVGDRVERTIDLLVAGVHLSESLVSEQSPGAEETSAVGSGVVSQTSLETVLPELLGVGGSDNSVTNEGSVDNLGDYALVGAADAETVLAGIVLVLFLED